MTRAPAPETPRGPGYLFTGLVLGFVLGLVLAWWVWPVEYRDVAPASLRADFKQVYRSLIAVAYWARPDPVRARARLALLQDPDPQQALFSQAQQSLAQNPWPWESEALDLLARALFQPKAVASVLARTPTEKARPTATSIALAPTPTPALRVSPTAPPSVERSPTPSPTPVPLFRVVHRELFCDPARRALLHIEVYDAQGNPLPGVVLEISWERGQERLVTGMKPELGLGYADFQMEPEETYRLRVVTGSEILMDLQPPQCADEHGAYPGGWQIVFQAVP